MINWQFKYNLIDTSEFKLLGIEAYDVYRNLSKEPTIGGGKINNMFFQIRFTDMFAKRRIIMYPFFQTGDTGSITETDKKSHFFFFIKAFDNLGSQQFTEDLNGGSININLQLTETLYKLEIIETDNNTQGANQIGLLYSSLLNVDNLQNPLVINKPYNPSSTALYTAYYQNPSI